MNNFKHFSDLLLYAQDFLTTKKCLILGHHVNNSVNDLYLDCLYRDIRWQLRFIELKTSNIELTLMESTTKVEHLSLKIVPLAMDFMLDPEKKEFLLFLQQWWSNFNS